MEQVPSAILILVMALMTLMLIHGIINRKKKEQLERLYEDKEVEIEEFKGEEHLHSAEYLEKTYQEKITRLKEDNRRMMLEYEEKIEILTAKYKREIANLKEKIK